MANCECHTQMVIRNHMLYYIMICLDVRLPLQNEDSTMVGTHCGTIIPINVSTSPSPSRGCLVIVVNLSENKKKQHH